MPPSATAGRSSSIVVVFLSSLFTGMGVLVARFAGANQPEKVNRVVYQAFLTAFALSVLLAAIGYFASPSLLDIVNAAPEVQHEALPFLRAMFIGIFGMMMFFMLSGAFRAAGDAHTPLRLGVSMTVLTIVLQRDPDSAGSGPIGAAFGTIASSSSVALYGLWRFTRPSSVIHFERGMDRSVGLHDHPIALQVRPADRVQGIAMNVGGVLMLRFIGSLEQSAAAQAAYAVCYTQLFSLITWTSNGLLGAAATIAGQNLGAGNPDRAVEGVRVASRIGFCVAAVVGFIFVTAPHLLLAIFGMKDPAVQALAQQLLFYLSFSGLFITVALSYTGGLQGTGDTRSPLYISIDLAGDHSAWPVHASSRRPAASSRPTSGWRSSSAT